MLPASPVTVNTPKRMKFAFVSNKLDQLKSAATAPQIRDSFEKEISSYMNTTFDTVDKNTHAGKFWMSERVAAWPQLKPVVVALAGFVGSSVAVEQMFSISGLKYIGRRNR